MTAFIYNLGFAPWVRLRQETSRGFHHPPLGCADEHERFTGKSGPCPRNHESDVVAHRGEKRVFGERSCGS